MSIDSRPVAVGEQMRAQTINAMVSDIRKLSVGMKPEHVPEINTQVPFHTPFSGSYVPGLPLSGDPQLTVGRHRAFTGGTDEAFSYPWVADRITWVHEDCTATVKKLTVPDVVDIDEDRLYVYYAITCEQRTITAELETSDEWPPDPDEQSEGTEYVLVGIARWNATTGISGWHQVLQGEIRIDRSAPYWGPFKVVASDVDELTLGPDRAQSWYPHKDYITIVSDDNTVYPVHRTPAGPETISSVTTSRYVYMSLTWGLAGYDYALATSTIWPPHALAADVIPILVAYVKCDAGEIVSVSQLLRSTPTVFDRPVFANAQCYYRNGKGYVNKMSVRVGDEVVDIPTKDYSLSSDTTIYIEYSHTLASGAISILSTYQTGTPTHWDYSSGVVTYQIPIAAIKSGKMIQYWLGDYHSEIAKVQNSIEWGNSNYDYLQLVGDEASPGTNQAYSTDHDGKKGWHPRGFWAEITSETGAGVYAMKALDKAGLTLSATEHQLTTGLTVGWKFYVQHSDSGTSDKYYFVASGAAEDELVASKSGQTAGYLEDIITDGDSAAFSATTDIQVLGETTTVSGEVKLYVPIDSVDDYDATDPIGVIGTKYGAVAMLEGIELSDALKLISGHGTSKTLETDAVTGDPKWV